MVFVAGLPDLPFFLGVIAAAQTPTEASAEHLQSLHQAGVATTD